MALTPLLSSILTDGQPDTNGNVVANNFVPGYATTPTAANTTVLTVASKEIQRFAGVTTQTVTLPVATTLPQTGFGFWIINDSTGALTVQSSGANAVNVMAGGTRMWVWAILLTGTDAASWDFLYSGSIVASGKALTVSNSLTLAGTDGTVMTFPPASASVGYLGIPISSKSADYPIVLADASTGLLHAIADNNPRTFTIPANGTIPFPVGSVLVFYNLINTLSIAITSDTMYLADDGSTGTRTLSPYGVASATKLSSTVWLIGGSGLA